MQTSFLLFVVLLFFPCRLYPGEDSSLPEVYKKIKDIKHPTKDDYRLIQDYLSKGIREPISRMKDQNYEYVMRTFKIIGDTTEETPRAAIVPINSSAEEKNNCILIYSSFNRHYPKGLKRLVDHIKKSDFKGHVLYRLGGWPDEAGGSLVLAHVPYAFKVSYFKEAQRLGYKRAFWLDTAVVPLVSLNSFFKMIEEKGYFIMGNTHMIGPYMNERAAKAFGLSVEETYKIPSCSAGICGIDFTHEKGAKIVDLLYQAAHHPDAFYSARSDQNALSIILYQMGITDFVSMDRMPHTEIGDPIKPDSLLLLDRLFTH